MRFTKSLFLSVMSLVVTTNANAEHFLPEQISEECRDYINQDEWTSGQNARCLAYRILISELNIGDVIRTKVDQTYSGAFTLFNGFSVEYDPEKKSFMSKIRPNDEVLLTKIYPRHSVCNLRAEIEHGLAIWNMRVQSRGIETNFEFTYTATKKFCGGSSMNYSGDIFYDSPETTTRRQLIELIYE